MNLLLLSLLLSVNMHVQPSTRSLLLFGKAQPEFNEQLTLLKQDSSGIAERDLVIIIIEKEAEYKKYNVIPNQFTLLLIGKDGGEKLRSSKPVEIETIFQLIDSMPMRQAEMKSKKTG
jgi:hypothetical protein